jgi:uncharacterized protein YndB with AHSA1/START domain
MSTSEPAVEKVIIELVIAAPIDTVWRALRDPAEIARWFGWNYASLADEITYIFETHATADDAEHRLTMAGFGDVFTLTREGEGTLVRVVRAAPAGTDWDGIYDEVVEGWRTFVEQLRFVLERHPMDTKRTLYLSGRTREHGPRPPAALGLDALAAVGAGQAYALSAAPGDSLTGTVWFRSAHQIGLTINGMGDGLLITHNRPPTPASPHGGGMVVLTTYGLDDAAYDALRARWTSWWRGVFELTDVEPKQE